LFKVQQLELDTAQRQKFEEKVSQRWAHKEMSEDTKAVYVFFSTSLEYGAACCISGLAYDGA
jgi:hypothetical protein